MSELCVQANYIIEPEQATNYESSFNITGLLEFLRKSFRREEDIKKTEIYYTYSKIDVTLFFNRTISTYTDKKQLLISELGWTNEQVLEARMRLSSFEDDWNAAGMEVYDYL